MSSAPINSDWRVVGATTTGRSHSEFDLPNQDCHDDDYFDGVQVLAVADGAGSRQRSDVGAKIAVDAALATARTTLVAKSWTQLTVRMWADDCLKDFDRRLQDEIADRTQMMVNPRSAGERPGASEPRDDYATTLLAVAWRGDSYAIFGVGDCFLMVDRAPGGAYLLSSSEYRENTSATVFMTSRNREDYLQVDLLVDQGVRGVALCSDGLAEALLSLKETSQGGFRYVAPPPVSVFFDFFANGTHPDSALEDRLASPEFAEASSDDKTMILAVRKS